MMPVRIGAVSYLNTKPLIYGLPQLLGECELTLDLPSRLADRLVTGQLDIALIPSVEYFRNISELTIVSDACIACRGAVRSVQLLFRKSPPEVQTLALDEGSRTSAVLAQILLAERYNVRPTCMPLPIEDDFSHCSADAVLVIGDRAMKIDPGKYVQCWDLGEQWNYWAKLPFVFAMWVAKSSQLQRPEIVEAIAALQRSRDLGLTALEGIAQLHADRYGLTVQDCWLYFKEQLHFVLAEDERSGLNLFQSHADHLGLLSPASSLDHRALALDMVSNSFP